MYKVCCVPYYFTLVRVDQFHYVVSCQTLLFTKQYSHPYWDASPASFIWACLDHNELVLEPYSAAPWPAGRLAHKYKSIARVGFSATANLAGVTGSLYYIGISHNNSATRGKIVVSSHSWALGGFLYCLQLLCHNMNSSSNDLVTQVGDRGLHETAFGFLRPKTVLLWPGKCFLKILQVFLVRCPAAGYQDVIEVTNDLYRETYMVYHKQHSAWHKIYAQFWRRNWFK